MNIKSRKRILRPAIACLVASAFSPAFAQKIAALPLLDEAGTPPPFVTVATQPVQKALPLAGWQWTGYTNDQMNLAFLLYSGTFASRCIDFTVPTWTITITRDGVPFWIQQGNAWQNVDFGQRCGLNWSVPKGNQFEVLTPGTYEFRMSQPQFGADIVVSFVLPPCINTANLPVYSARHEAYTDNFYTVDPSELNSAVSNYGYSSTGVGFRNSRSNEKTAPWKRFFKGAPQIEHVYLHLAHEEQSVYPFGYVYERNEGNVFPTQVAGTVPLFRLTKYDGATGGLEHAYTISTAQVASLQSQGWTAEGEKGWVCAP
ncbi:MAG TPA: hypothetical protein VFU13_22945 [Steroidobacteraceae bacterium]|nr:hypothetical protein [Steroidobacteraceae bacterium]